MSKKRKKKKNLMDEVYATSENYSKEKLTPSLLQGLCDLVCNKFSFLETSGSSLYIYYQDYFQPFTFSFGEKFLEGFFRENGINFPFRSSDYKELVRLIRGKKREVKHLSECKTNEHRILYNDCVLDIRDGLMHKPCREDYMFSKISYDLEWDKEFTPTSEARGFIQRFCGDDPKKERYLWELIGYLLSGYEKKIIVAFWGPGGSGKSTLANMIRRICGPSACVSIGIKELSGSFKIAELQGKKLCVDSDMDATVLDSRDIGIIKRLTGKDHVMGERKYENPFYFQNQAKFLLCMNNKIRIDTNEETTPFLDCFRVFDLDSAIPYQEQKADMDKILDENRRYFLHEAMKGLIRLVKNNFKFSYYGPDREFIENVHRREADVSIKEFLSTCCRFEEEFHETFSDLYAAYRTYAIVNGYDFASEKRFSKVLCEKYGLTKSRTSSARVINGIQLHRTMTDDTSV